MSSASTAARLVLSLAAICSGLVLVSGVSAQSSGSLPLHVVPAVVASHRASVLGRVNASAKVSFLVELRLRHAAQLRRVITAASRPGSPSYGHYLSQAQFDRRFAPNLSSQSAVVAWLHQQGLSVTRTFSNRLILAVSGSASTVDRALAIQLLTFRRPSADGSRVTTFRSPSSDPSIPSRFATTIRSIIGLDTASFAVSDLRRTPIPAHARRHGTDLGYFPSDFRAAYDVPVTDTGVAQHVGIVMWCQPPSDTALKAWGQATGSSYPSRVAKTLVVHTFSDAYGNSADQDESDLDVEASSGMAPDATIDYYETGVDSGSCSADTASGDTATLVEALNAAASSSTVNVISNSWGECEDPGDGFASQLDPILESGVATGHDFFFASGDYGSYCPAGNASTDDPWPFYPATSSYATAVGGTSFGYKCSSTVPSTITEYPGETAWCYASAGQSNDSAGNGPCDGGANTTCPEGSSGGYSLTENRPTWQLELGSYNPKLGKCADRGATGCRAEPDVAANADPSRGGLYLYENQGQPGYDAGGTSLSSPLWAGMLADVNSYLNNSSQPALGFANPMLYDIGDGYDGASYTSDFNQINPVCSADAPACTNGKYSTSASWNAVDGLGSPNVLQLQNTIETIDSSSTGGVPADLAPPSIDGRAVVGATLTEINGSRTNAPTSFTYQWERCNKTGSDCSRIQAQTSQTYKVSPADIGHRLRMSETAHNAAGAGNAVVSAQTALAIEAAPPSSSNRPTITGTTSVGSRLTEHHANWSNRPTGYSYQWKRCDPLGSHCSNIKGATGPHYRLERADTAHKVKVTETARNSAGMGSPVTSKGTVRIAPNA